MRYLPICLLFVGTALAACQTEFYGSPKFPNGIDGCRAACSHDGLEFGAFVYSGEFATSCVCQAPRASGPATAGAPSDASSVASQTEAASAAAVSVAIQRAEQQRRRSQMHVQ